MRKIIGIILISFHLNGFAQDASTSEFQWYEDTLNVLSVQMIRSADEAERIEASQQFKALLYQALTFDNSFDYSFDELANISRLQDSEGRFRIFNWSLRSDRGLYTYYAFMLLKQDDRYKLIEWYDVSTVERSRPLDEVFDTDHWYGAFYYQLVEVKKRKKRQYLLLGWDGYEFDSNQKIIEVLNIDKEGNVSFGAPIFQMEDKVQCRYFLRFKDDAAVSLRYYPEREEIVFDHLVPLQPLMEDMYQFYVSDFTYDAFKHSNFKWKFQSGVDARNMNDQVKKPKNVERRLFED